MSLIVFVFLQVLEKFQFMQTDQKSENTQIVLM